MNPLHPSRHLKVLTSTGSQMGDWARILQRGRSKAWTWTRLWIHLLLNTAHCLSDGAPSPAATNQNLTKIIYVKSVASVKLKLAFIVIPVIVLLLILSFRTIWHESPFSWWFGQISLGTSPWGCTYLSLSPCNFCHCFSFWMWGEGRTEPPPVPDNIPEMFRDKCHRHYCSLLRSSQAVISAWFPDILS